MIAMLAGCVLSLLFAKATGVDRCTALLVLFPGALGAVTAIAEEKSRHASVVVAVQTLRVASVLLFVSVLTGLSTPAGSSSAVAAPGAFAVFAAVLAPTWLAWWVLRQVSSPLPGFFAGLLVGFACYALRHTAPPEAVATLGQVLLGIAAGESIAAGLRLFCLLDRRTEKPVTSRSRAGSELSYLARRTERNAAR